MRVFRHATLLLWLLVFRAVGFSQLDRASLSGVVTDSSGGVVPDAKITAVQTATQAKFEAISNESGIYNAVGLPIGEYSVAVEKSGFKKTVRSGILLSANSSLRVDLTIAPGELTESVEVTAPSPLVEERSSAIGVSLKKETLENLPVSQGAGQGRRDLYSVLAFTPGVTNAGFQNNINGGVGFGSQIMMDGISAEYDMAVAGIAQIRSSVEIIDEFKLVNSVAPEYGLAAGAFMNVVTKSGTNDFHGNAYYFLGNDALNARNFFSPTVPIRKDNEWGVILGGPIKRNKTFFFFNRDDFERRDQVASQLLSLPTNAFKSGDFSALLGPTIGADALGRPVQQGQIYDPRTSRPDGRGGVIRDPFPGNIIPTDRFSTVSSKYQAFYPAPTYSNLLTNNYVVNSGVSKTEQPGIFVKLDHNLGASDRISGSYRKYWHSGRSSVALPDFFGAGASKNPQWSLRLNYNKILSPQVINDITFGIDRLFARQGVIGDAIDGGTKIGLTGTFRPCTPAVGIAGISQGSASSQLSPQNCDGENRTFNWKLNESLSYFKSKHNIKVGGTYHLWSSNNAVSTQSNGQFSFSPLETSLPGLGGTGFAYASFLLGEVDSGILRRPQTPGQEAWALGFFLQDEYRVKPKLTLSYGLRYDYQPQWTITDDFLSSFDPTVPNPAAGGILGALTFLGEGPGRLGTRRLGETYGKAFAPRFGFAYSLTSNTVIRGSYGLFYAPVSQTSPQGGALNQQGFFPQATLTSPDSGITPAFNWTSGFPSNDLSPTRNIGPSVSNGQATSFVGRDSARPGQVQQFNFGMQHQFRGRTLLETNYIGNLSHHISSVNGVDINQLDYGRYGSLGPLLLASVSSPAAVAAGIRLPYPGFSGSVAQALRPFPQFQGINEVNAPIGNSTYHAVQFKVQQQLTNGFSFLVGYTISKTLTDIGATPGFFAALPQDSYNRRAEKALSDADIPQALLFSYTYDLPVGPGKKVLNRQDIISKHVLGGWTIAGNHTYLSGRPLSTITNQRLPASQDSTANGARGLRPYRVADAELRTPVSCADLDPARDLLLNRAALSSPAPFTFGNASRFLGDVRSCGTKNEDFSISKYFPVTERVRIRFGTEFFNAFNRVNFSAPATNFDNLNFGRIAAASAGRVVRFNLKVYW